MWSVDHMNVVTIIQPFLNVSLNMYVVLGTHNDYVDAFPIQFFLLMYFRLPEKEKQHII